MKKKPSDEHTPLIEMRAHIKEKLFRRTDREVDQLIVELSKAGINTLGDLEQATADEIEAVFYRMNKAQGYHEH